MLRGVFFWGGDQLPIPTRYKISAKSRGLYTCNVKVLAWEDQSPPRPRMLAILLIAYFSRINDLITLYNLTNLNLNMSNESKTATWLEIFQTQTDQRNFPVKVADDHTTLFVNKFSFAGCSLVFQTALFGDFKEARDGEFKFPTKSVDEIVELFACLLCVSERPRKEVEIGKFSQLWDLANEYLIEVRIDIPYLC